MNFRHGEDHLVRSRFSRFNDVNALRRVREAVCVMCSKRPDHIEIEHSASDEGWIVWATCRHGSPARSGWELTAPCEEAFMPFEEMGLEEPLRFFRRNWAEYRRPTVRELLEKLSAK